MKLEINVTGLENLEILLNLIHVDLQKLSQNAPTPVTSPEESTTIVKPVEITPKAEEPKIEAPKYKLEDLARAGAALASNSANILKIQEVLQTFGISTIKDLEEPQFNKFAEALKKIGADL